MSDERRPPTEPAGEIRVEGEGEERRIVAELDLASPPSAVWSAITEGQEIERWFSFQARSRPGEGGELWLSWDGMFEDTLRIRAWEPDRHLRTDWRIEDPQGRESELVVDWWLESRGGGTRLRLVHSGFGAGEDWDDIVDGHRRGWAVELRCLRHYLEHHRGHPRGLVRASCPVPGSRDDAWLRVLAAPGWLTAGSLDGVTGDRVEALTASGERLAGRVLLREQPTDLALALDTLGRGFLRVSVGRWPGDEVDRLRLWLLCWRLDDDERTRLERQWQATLDEALAAPSSA